MPPRGREKKPGGSFSITAAWGTTRSAHLQELKYSSWDEVAIISVSHTQSGVREPTKKLLILHIITCQSELTFWSSFREDPLHFSSSIPSAKSAKPSLSLTHRPAYRQLSYFFRSLLAICLWWDQRANKTVRSYNTRPPSSLPELCQHT